MICYDIPLVIAVVCRGSTICLLKKKTNDQKPILRRTMGRVSLPSENEGEYRANSPPAATLAMRTAGPLFSANLPD